MRGQEERDLVATQVERADREREPAERFDHLAVHAQLAFEARGIAGVEEQEFGPEQSDSVEVAPTHLVRLLAAPEVGANGDSLPITGGALRGLDRGLRTGTFG